MKTKLSLSPSGIIAFTARAMGGTPITKLSQFKCFVAAASLLVLFHTGIAATPTTPTQLFNRTKVWSVHLHMTPAQFEAMEPEGGGFGGPGGPADRGGLDLADMAVPGFMAGDKDKDGKLSEEEFRQLGTSWFTAWDKEKLGKLTLEQLRAGISATFPMPGFPGGGGRRGPVGMPGPGRAKTKFPVAHADLEFEGTMLKDVAIRYKGNSTYAQSRNSLKRSLKIDLNQYIKGQKLAGVTKLNLHSNVTDAGFMNEPISYQLFRDAEVPSGRTAYARVFLTVPGKYENKYVGLYSLVEEVDKHFARERFPEGGAIFKPETHSLFGVLEDDWAAYEKTYDPKTNVSKAQQQRLIEFAKFLDKANDAEFAAGIASYLDLDEFARFMATTVWLVNGDSILSMGHNFYIYLHPKTNQFLFFPWDLDLSFGHFPGLGGTGLSILHPWLGENRFLERVFQVAAFKEIYLTHLAAFNKSIFAPQRITAMVDESAPVIRAAVAEESSAKLALFEKTVAGEALVPAVYSDGLGREPGTSPRMGGMVLGGGTPIKAFVQPRSKSVADQLSGKPASQSANGGPGFMGMGAMGKGGLTGMLLGPGFFTAMDTDKNGSVSREEFQAGFARWFESWGGRANGELTEEQIRAGLNRDFPRPQGMPGLGPPPGAPSARP